MGNLKISYEEHKMLREELHNLKDCQVKFLTYSVTATGIILGLAVSFSSIAPLSISSLFPLTILIPTWWIFFDKATTITRIVGYYRILERRIIDPLSVKNFLGWENALAKFRELQKKGELRFESSRDGICPIATFFKLFILRTPHRYWLLTYYTFFALSLLCLALSLYSGVTVAVGSIATVLIVISAVWNINIIWGLIEGKHSYNANEDFWKKIFGAGQAD
jgi:hypothetical protein